MSNVLELNNITKYYGEHKVLDQIDLKIGRGEIVGLIGANGSGKSTLLNILSGNSQIEDSGGYQGHILIDGNVVNIRSHKIASENGIGMVHQELSLFENFDVGTNITLTRESLKPYGIIDKRKTHQSASEELKKLGCQILTKDLVKKLPISLKQFVEIAREVNKKNLKLILLDEPTSSLTKEGANQLIETIRFIRSQGTSVIFVSHRLEEVVGLCDRIIVLKDGKKVSEYNKGSYDIEVLAKDMIGKSFVKAYRKKSDVEIERNVDETYISFNIEKAFDGHRTYENLKLDIKKSEIIGITGLAGHGQTIFSESIVGNVPIVGEICYADRPIPIHDIKKNIQEGIVVIQEDRKGKSLLLNRSIEKNITFTALHTSDRYLLFPKLKRLSLTRDKLIFSDAQACIDQYNIKCRSIKQKVRELSGGNQQKVCFARALLVEPKVLFVGEPTRGIDLYSKEIVLNMMLDINQKKGTTIIISSSELDELKRICDRIVIMYEGGIFKIVAPDADDEVFSLAISGQK